MPLSCTISDSDLSAIQAQIGVIQTGMNNLESALLQQQNRNALAASHVHWQLNRLACMVETATGQPAGTFGGRPGPIDPQTGGIPKNP